MLENPPDRAEHGHGQADRGGDELADRAPSAELGLDRPDAPIDAMVVSIFALVTFAFSSIFL